MRASACRPLPAAFFVLPSSSDDLKLTPHQPRSHQKNTQRLEAVNPALAAERARAIAKQREAKKARAEALAKIKADKAAEDKAFAADEVRLRISLFSARHRRDACAPVGARLARLAHPLR